MVQMVQMIQMIQMIPSASNKDASVKKLKPKKDLKALSMGKYEFL